jgi:hypothetical protein
MSNAYIKLEIKNDSTNTELFRLIRELQEEPLVDNVYFEVD